MNSEPHSEGAAIIRREVEVRNRLGIHARPANMIARAAMQFTSRVEIFKGNECIDATSIISLLTLGAEKGTVLEIQAVGEDAERAVNVICDLFDRCFEEDEELTS
jgi:phosphocarrier protein HPr